MSISRRDFIQGSAAGIAIAAGLAIGLAERIPTLYPDGIGDNTEALQSIFSGGPAQYQDGSPYDPTQGMRRGTYRIAGTVDLGSNRSVRGNGA